MTKILLSIFLTLAASLSAASQDRFFVITDRPAYIAGDIVGCSVFCAGEDGHPDSFSSVCYLELIGGDGTAVETKISLLDGRGAGSFRIPQGTPTGNYSLIAYSSRSEHSPEASRRIAVFNTTSTSRAANGVVVSDESDYKPNYIPEGSSSGGLRLNLEGDLSPLGKAVLTLDGLDDDTDLAISVFHDDGLDAGDGKTLAGFSAEGGKAVPTGNSGEYEGETIKVSVEGLTAEEASRGDKMVILSTPGSPSEVYIGRITSDGHVDFITNNIYGDRELVCEVTSMQGKACHISISSPFRHPSPDVLPPLELNPAQREALVARKAALISGNVMLADTLARFLPKREGLLLEAVPSVHYHLDDYSRFPTVKEMCVEFISELRFMENNGNTRLRMFVSDAGGTRKYAGDNVLVMMDGVVLTDHGMLNDFDAMLLEDVYIYPQTVIIGGVPFNGVVNFVSKNNYVTRLHFPPNVRVMDFKGASYPVYYAGGRPAGDKDLRQVLYWHPAFEAKAGRRNEINLEIPGYKGRFKAVAEGWKRGGIPVRAEYTFEIQ